MTEEETPLHGGRVTAGVVRVGRTVRRPIGPHSLLVHRLLGHLEERGFAGAPRFLGVDSSNREILSFLPGRVAPDLGQFSDVQLDGAARLLRGLHDATAGSPLCDGSEVVCHGDPSPCNCLFVDGVPSAFIDFDAAHPGRRQDDLAYAAWLWLDIGEQDLDPVSQGRRLGRFFTAYGCQSDIDPVQAVLAAQLELANRPSAPPSTKAWAKSCRAWAEQSKSALLDGVAETAV